MPPITKFTHSLLVQSFLAADKKSIIIATIASVISGVCSAALIAFIAKQVAISEVISTHSVLAFGFLLLASVVASLFASKKLIAAASLHSYNLRLELCRKTISTPFEVIEKIDSHQLIASLTEDLNTIAAAFSRIPTIISNFTKVFFCALYLFWLSPLSGLILLVVLSPILYIQLKLLRRVKQKTEFLLPIRDQRFGFYQSLTSGIKELNINPKLRRDFYHDNLKPNALAFRNALQETTMAGAYASQWGQSSYFVVVFGLVIVVSYGFLPNDIITAFALIGLYIRGSVNGLLQVAPVWIKANAAMTKIDSLGLYDDDPEYFIPDENYSLESAKDEVNLRLQQVHFSYEKADAKTSGRIGPLSLELQSSELVFVTGGNGSGKTTLVKLLTALYEPSSGSILLNNRLINEKNIDWYKNHFYVVFSDYCLFNVLLQDLEKNNRKQYDALLTQLQLEDQNNRIVGEGSRTKLSAGQRARLALIPALLSDRSIVIFDEWAANQDLEFKNIFYYQLLPELKKAGKLVIVVSHDDRFFNVSDRVIRLESGLISDDQYGPQRSV